MNALAVTILAPAAAAAVVIALALRKFARRRQRRAWLMERVPPDGAALNHRERCEWTGFLRGWKQTAPEPVYDDQGEL